MINIKPSASIRNNYNEISSLCKESGEPVYLTKNGEEGHDPILYYRTEDIQKSFL